MCTYCAFWLGSLRPESGETYETGIFFLTYKFINVSDSTPHRFGIRFVADYPKVDSFSVIGTGLADAAIGYQIKETMDRKGLPGVWMTMVFSVNKIWPDQWPNQKPPYPTDQWFYVETCTAKDSTYATMSFVWPQDTALAYVHAFIPDTTDPDYNLWGADGTLEPCKSEEGL